MSVGGSEFSAQVLLQKSLQRTSCNDLADIRSHLSPIKSEEMASIQREMSYFANFLQTMEIKSPGLGFKMV